MSMHTTYMKLIIFYTEGTFVINYMYMHTCSTCTCNLLYMYVCVCICIQYMTVVHYVIFILCICIPSTEGRGMHTLIYFRRSHKTFFKSSIKSIGSSNPTLNRNTPPSPANILYFSKAAPSNE